jgi:membrane protease YdiL (CAAX protease family)
MTFLPFALLLVAVLGLWIHRAVWLGALGAAIVAAYFSGALHGLAVLWIALLGALTWFYKTRAASGPRWQQLLAGLARFVFGIVMGLALLPGFPRVNYAADVVLSPGAAPYTLGFGFPKVVGGIFILGILRTQRVASFGELARVLARVAPIYLVMVTVVMAFTLAAGYVHWDPKWTPLFFAWAAANLFFTCMAEEAFFRGFVQHELAKVGSDRKRAAIIAITVSSVLFGLAHFAGGWKYALAAILAGVGYGLAYHRTQRIEASMAVHFGLNAAHFLLFTYPALA